MPDSPAAYLPGPVSAGRLFGLIAALEEEGEDVVVDVDLDTGLLVLACLRTDDAT